MGVRTTDAQAVALYDSTEGVAFGPVFESEDLAESYLLWLAKQGLGPRNLTAFEHKRQQERWFEAKVDAETGILTDDAWVELADSKADAA